MEEIVFVEKPCDLNVIKKEAVQLAVWRQKQAPKFVAALSDPSLSAANLPAFQGLFESSETGEVAQVLKSYLWRPYNLRSQKDRALVEEDIDELVEQIDQLVHIFVEIVNEPAIHVKLEAISDDGCRNWHQDFVPYRLVATYRGPCTEFVPPTLSKSTLQRRHSNCKHAQSLLHSDVALFKGRGCEDDDCSHDHPGIVHRSPRNTGHRVVLILDIPQKGWHY